MALTPAGNDMLQLHDSNATNPSLKKIAIQSVNALTQFVEVHYPDTRVSITSPKFVYSSNGNVVKNILVEPAEAVTPALEMEILAALIHFIDGMVTHSIGLLSRDDVPKLGEDKVAFIKQLAEIQIQKSWARNIGRPSLVEVFLPNSKILEIPVQGSFRQPVQKHKQCDEFIEIFAYADGVWGSELTVYLKTVCSKSHVVSSGSKPYSTQKHSHTLVAAQAYLDGNQLLRVLLRESIDQRGKETFFIELIELSSLEQMPQLENQLDLGN